MLNEIIKKAKDEYRKVYIYSHKNADGDAVASSVALRDYLRKFDIEAEYVTTQKLDKFVSIAGKIDKDIEVEEDNISVIIDTNSEEYVDGFKYENSSKNNTYVIDHHSTAPTIETNNYYFSNKTSCAEVLLGMFDDKYIDHYIANKLAYGLLTDTGKLKYADTDTFKNLSKLFELGLEYDKVMSKLNHKTSLKEDQGFAFMFRNTELFDLGSMKGTITFIDKKERDYIQNKYGIKNIHKKLFRIGEIEDVCLNALMVENEDGYDIEFRTNKNFGDVDASIIATTLNGGGHKYASGASIKPIPYPKESIKNIAIFLYKQQEKLKNYEPSESIKEILDKTNNLTENVDSYTMFSLLVLMNQDENYQDTYCNYKPLKDIQMKNDILLNMYVTKDKETKESKFVVNNNLYTKLTEEYKATESDIKNILSKYATNNETIVIEKTKKLKK